MNVLKRLSQRELRRMQARMMNSLGISLNELGKASEVSIKLEDGKVIRLRDASIVSMDTNVGKIYQIIGGEEIEEGVGKEPVQHDVGYEPSAEDIAIVTFQTGVSEERARQALIEAKGDLAKAILSLKSG